MRVAKARGWLLTILACFFLAACETSDFGLEADEKGPQEVPAPRDTTPPTIAHTVPDADARGVRVQTAVSVEFDELVNEAQLRDGRIRFFAGRDIDTEGFFLSERPFVATFDTVDATIIDLVTGEPKLGRASRLKIAPPSGRLALDTTYTYRIFLPTEAEFNRSDAERAELDRREEELLIESGTNTSVKEQLEQLQRDRFRPIDFFFSVESGAWVEPQDLSLQDQDGPLLGAISGLVLDSNSVGDVVAAVQQVKDGFAQVFVSRFLSTQQRWVEVDNPASTNNATQLSTIADTHVQGLTLDISEQGHVAVAWYQQSAPGALWSAWLRVYDGATWSAPIRIGATDQPVSHPSLAFDSLGRLLVGWRESNGSNFQLRAGIYALSASNGLVSGWNHVRTVSTLVGGDVFAPKVLVDAENRMSVIWLQAAAGAYRTLQHASMNNLTRNWSAPQRVDTNNAGSVDTDFAVALSSNNEALVVWPQFDGTRYNLWSRRMSGGNWQASALLERDNTGDVAAPAVVVDGFGNYVVAWNQVIEGAPRLRVQRMDATAKWGAVADLEGGGVGLLARPALAFDFEGHLSAAWNTASVEGASAIRTRRQVRQEPWKETTQISGTSSMLVGAPKLVPIMQDGRMLAVWSDASGLGSKLRFNQYLEQSREQ